MFIHDMQRWRRVPGFFLTLICLSVVCGFCESTAAEKNILIFPQIYVLQQDAGAFGLSLTNDALVTGVQVRFTYAMQGFHIHAVTLTSRTTGYDPPLWQMTSFDSGTVEIEVILFSQYGAAIIPGSGDILTFHYHTSAEVAGSTSLVLTKSVLADMALQPLAVNIVHGSMTAYTTPYDQFFGIENAPVKVSIHPIPEPATFVLFAGGLLLLLAIKKTRR